MLPGMTTGPISIPGMNAGPNLSGNTGGDVTSGPVNIGGAATQWATVATIGAALLFGFVFLLPASGPRKSRRGSTRSSGKTTTGRRKKRSGRRKRGGGQSSKWPSPDSA